MQDVQSRVMVAVKFQTARFTMEHTLRQLQFNFGFLATLRTGLAGIVGWHLMEVFAITFCHPVAPVKEHTPSRVRDRLGKVSVLYHIARFKFLCDNRIKPFVMEKGVSRFCDKVKALTGDNIRLLRQCVFRLIPSSALVLLARQVAVKLHEFVFRLAIKARVGYLLTIRSRQKVLYAYIHTTSRLRNTGHRIRHFANDKGNTSRVPSFST